jgi:hypothetical protein
MRKVMMARTISWDLVSGRPRPARNESSCWTTTSAAAPINNGGARSKVLFSIEKVDANTIRLRNGVA